VQLNYLELYRTAKELSKSLRWTFWKTKVREFLLAWLSLADREFSDELCVWSYRNVQQCSHLYSMSCLSAV